MYRYCADLCLSNYLDKKHIQLAQEYLWKSIKLHPKILREKYAQQIITKFLIKKILPLTIYQNVILIFKKMRAISRVK